MLYPCFYVTLATPKLQRLGITKLKNYVFLFVLHSTLCNFVNRMEIFLPIIGLVFGLIVGSGVVYFILSRRLSSTSSLLEVERTKLLSKVEDIRQLETLYAEVNEKYNTTDAEFDKAKVELERVRTLLNAERAHNSEIQQARQQQFDQQLKTVQEQFANLASKILDSTTDKLKAESGEAIEAITKPLRDNLQQLSQALERTNNVSAQNTASLSAQLKEMGERTDRIDQTASRLTNVLRGGNQVQGQWGERILTDILDAQGFKLGVDYDVQQTLTDERGNTLINDETGKKMKPDVIIHYPNNEDVIVDAKMSIDAYYQYVNTEDETLRKQYAEALARSVRNQMMGLAKKDYSSYVKSPRRAIDYVIMFVPNEGALQLALATDPRLWGDAFDRQVFITSQQNLMAMLKIIQIAWRQYAQTENQKHVYELADELLKRMGHFLQLFEGMRKDIDAIDKHYTETYKKIFEGRQSISQKANELKLLGAKEHAKYPIPDTLPSIDES